MKKTIIYFLTALGVISVLALTACSSDGNNTETSSSSSSQTEKKQEAIYEHLQNAKNEIWYVATEVSKESYPSYIYVFNKGEVKGYSFFDSSTGKSFGELAQMSDKEILRYYEEQEGVALKELSEKADSFYEKISQDEVAKETAEAYKKYADGSSSLPAVKYTVKLLTDDTGNSVVSENIDINLLGVGQQASEVGEFPHYTVILQNVTSQTTVFDSHYNGFETGDPTNPLFITRSKNQFILDTPKTKAKGLEID